MSLIDEIKNATKKASMKNDDLRTKYPALYGQLSHFECGDGWYQILDNLSKEIVEILEKNPSLEPPKFVQIKEKFGTLRAYYDGDHSFDRLISKAEKLSEHICEACGKPGKEQPGGWIKILCDTCDKGRK